MKVLLIALGSAGDVHPLIGLGVALRARGHRVLLVTNPNFASLVERAGLEFVPIGTLEELHEAMADPDLWHPRRAFYIVVNRLMLPLMRPLYELVVEHYEPRSTVVAAPSTAIGARIAQEKLGVPLATIDLQPAILRSSHSSSMLPPMLMSNWVPGWFKQFQFWAADKLLLDRLVAPSVNSFRAELGLSPARSLLGDWWHSPQKVIGLFPDWFAPPQPDWPRNTVLTGFPLWDETGLSEIPPQLAEFLSAGSPPIAFTPGSAMLHGREFFSAAAEACRLLGRRGILLTRYAEQLPLDLPRGVRHFDFVPFSQLLPRCAALVHHGGIGSTAQALAAGIPQLVMPMSHDQPDNAARAARLGVASVIKPRKFRAKAVAASLASLLESPHVARSCREVAAKFDTPKALATACDEIERLSPAVNVSTPAA